MSQSSTPAVTDAIYDASSLGRPRMFLLGLQHLFAMFGATVLVLVLSLGIAYSTAGAIVLELGGVTISLSGLAVGSLVGIVLNAILPGNDFEFDVSELEEAAE